jgi:hypothetical protein
MYAVIEKTTRAVLRTCNTKEAALVACQLEKDKVGVAERGNITAVTMDDGGYSEIMFLSRFPASFINSLLQVPVPDTESVLFAVKSSRI